MSSNVTVQLQTVFWSNRQNWPRSLQLNLEHHSTFTPNCGPVRHRQITEQDSQASQFHTAYKSLPVDDAGPFNSELFPWPVYIRRVKRCLNIVHVERNIVQSKERRYVVRTCRAASVLLHREICVYTFHFSHSIQYPLKQFQKYYKLSSKRYHMMYVQFYIINRLESWLYVRAVL